MSRFRKMLTIEGVADIFENIVGRYAPIQSFVVNDIYDADSQENDLPVVVFEVASSELVILKNGVKQNKYTINLHCFEQRLEDWSNLNYVFNHTYICLNDIVAYFFEEPTYIDGQGIKLDGNVNFAKSIKRGNEKLFGWTATFSFTAPNMICYSELPIDPLPDGSGGYSGEGGEQGVYLTCESLSGCTTIQTIQSQISELYTLTGGTSSGGEYLPLSGGTLTGSVFGPTFSATTFYSGGTDLSELIGQGGGSDHNKTYISPGTNIQTGGTEDNYTISTVDSPVFVSMSATTIFSGGTDLSELIASGGGGSDHNKTYVQGGTNISTGGTEDAPTINLNSAITVASIISNYILNYSGLTNQGGLSQIGVAGFQGNVTFNGNNTYNGYNSFNGGADFVDDVVFYDFVEFNNDINHYNTFYGNNIIGSTSISAATFYSGSTDLSELINSLVSSGGSSHNKTFVQGGTNISTGGTVDAPTVNLNSAISVNTLTATTIHISPTSSSVNRFLIYNFVDGKIHYRTVDVDSFITEEEAKATYLSLEELGEQVVVGPVVFSGDVQFYGDIGIETLFGKSPVLYLAGDRSMTASTDFYISSVGQLVYDIGDVILGNDLFVGGAITASTLTVGGQAFDELDLVGLSTASTTSYTLQLSDRGKHKRFTSASDVTCVVPTNASVAFPLGTSITLMQANSGDVTISGATGVQIHSFSGLTTLAGQYAGASLTKIATNEWDLIGNLI